MRAELHRVVFFASALLAAVAVVPPACAAGGARHFKSGPIQITADGIYVWVANPDNDSVSRIDTRTDAVAEFVLPGPGNDRPLGVSVMEDGSEVWVACHDSDRVYLLRGSDGQVLGQIDTGFGTGPYSVALSPDQKKALVTLHRAAAVDLYDVPSRVRVRRLEPLFWSPLGIAWLDDGVTAWVTHLFADGEDPSLSRIDTTGPIARVTTRLLAKSTNPKASSTLPAAHRIAEGGYLTFRGHLAQLPAVSGKQEIWLPTQYNNINEDIFSPDSTVQTTIRHLDLVNRRLPNTNADKVILTAVHVHDPNAPTTLVGPGWDARVSGPIDIAFSADAVNAYVLNEQSNDLMVVPVATPASKPAAAPPLVEINVGWKPIGLALAPVADIAYVANQFSRSVSVVDLATLGERQIAVTPVTGEPFTATILMGARVFHSSVDPRGLGRISSNEKVACASCHPHAEHDGRTWDFESLPGNHGPRGSMSLLGVAQTHVPGARDPINNTWGLLHRSGDRDELQDFDFTFTGVSMMGTGFLGAAANPELGPANAGRDADLDAMADYLLSLSPLARSPRRTASAQLSEAALRGATFFVGSNRAGRRADSGCADCHIPESVFVDGTSHNVGANQPASERELNSRTPAWTSNTPTLTGVWTSPPYGGTSTWATTLVGVIKDAAGRAAAANPHGTPDGLTGRQLVDLAEFVASIDGGTTAAEVRGARDTVAPVVTRVEPASLSRINVWFSETIDAASATNPANWRLTDLSGPTVLPISSIAWDPQNGDRVDMTVALRAGCAPVDYRLEPIGVILDSADWATSGVANPMVNSDPANVRQFSLGSTLRITLGQSGYENITIVGHDSGMVGPSLSGWGHDSPWLAMVTAVTPNVSNKGFVRFNWQTPFSTVTGVTAAADILDAGFSIHPEFGDSQPLSVRRVLQSWSDTPTGNDWNSNPAGATTWNSHSHPSGAWNQTGARALGGTGTVVSDYNGVFDLSAVVDATATMPAINERVWFGGPLITDAYRFWLINPAVDYGHSIELAAGSTREVKFERGESEMKEFAPTLAITYSLGNFGPPAPTEVSGLAGGTPLWAVKAGGSAVRLSFEDLPTATSFNVYEGTIGNWFSHVGAGCNVSPVLVGSRREWSYSPGSQAYLQITGANGCAEGPAAAGWPSALNNCPP